MAKRFHEGKGGHANMPTEVKITTYSDPNSYLPENINDGIEGIDSQIAEDNAKKNKSLKPKKV